MMMGTLAMFGAFGSPHVFRCAEAWAVAVRKAMFEAESVTRDVDGARRRLDALRGEEDIPAFRARRPRPPFRPRNHLRRDAGPWRTHRQCPRSLSAGNGVRPRAARRFGRSETMLSEEPLRAEPVVLLNRTQHLSAGDLVPRERTWHRILPISVIFVSVPR